MKNPLSHYLQHYAADEIRCLAGFPGQFRHALVIPVHREPASQRQVFIDWAKRQGSTLLVLILNTPQTQADHGWGDPWWQVSESIHWQQGNLRLLNLERQSGLLLVDRLQQPVTGVGEARKIGNDILCQLFQQQQLSSPWLANSDADARLPDDYFTALENLPADTAAVVYPFEHNPADDPLLTLATRLYEFTLYYYQAGLRFACSPYAYQSLGSTLAIANKHYAAVRGFPLRQAGEDFYLLNKLAKTGGIHSLSGPVIQLASRHSNRAPFGTGPTVQRIVNHQPVSAWPCYHPSSFHYLQAFWQSLQQSVIEASGFATVLADSSLPASIDKTILERASLAMEVPAILAHCQRQGKTAEQRRRQLNTRFDAFQTLKLVHWLRDQALPNIRWHELIIHPDYLAIAPTELRQKQQQLWQQLNLLKGEECRT